jgi:hypothetical protein
MQDDDEVIAVETFGTEAPPPPPPQAERVDQVTGEVTADSPAPARAYNGEVLAPTARSAGAFVDLLEDGQFSMDAFSEVRELMSVMTDIANATGQKTKGKVTITIDLIKDGEAFTVQGKVQTKTPDMPRPKSIIWSDESGNPCRFPPRQVQMFGGARAPIRNIG